MANELYGITIEFDCSYTLSTILEKITTTFGFVRIPIVICTDSKSLYECLVKLGSTVEKRLMIDIMFLRESYEKRKIFEIRWIDGRDNPVDAFTKKNPNDVLLIFILINRTIVRVEIYVERTEKKKEE